MTTKHLNICARDSRISESLTGLGYSTLETLEQVYSSQIKIIGTSLYQPYLCIPTEYAKNHVHRVQVLKILTGGWFQVNGFLYAIGSSVAKTLLQEP